MTTVRSAFYARVSSEQQAAAHTIESQISALSERARSDGTPVPPERQFVDDGVSGATLARPALDRLRDLAAVGAIDRIYVHSPDRLARNYAYQVLLLDEWRRTNVERCLFEQVRSARARKTTYCSKCKASSLNMSEPSSWSVVGAVSGMQHRAAR